MKSKKDKQLRESVKKAYIIALQERLDDLIKNLAKIIREGDNSSKMIAKKKCVLETIAEVKTRIDEVKNSTFDGACKKCRKPIALLYLQDHLLTGTCEKCNKKR